MGFKSGKNTTFYIQVCNADGVFLHLIAIYFLLLNMELLDNNKKNIYWKSCLYNSKIEKPEPGAEIWAFIEGAKADKGNL